MTIPEHLRLNLSRAVSERVSFTADDANIRAWAMHMEIHAELDLKRVEWTPSRQAYETDYKWNTPQ